jgi:hypothetical protein
MESNGKRSRIHLSQETADLLIGAGKLSWVTVREDKIIAKGKGEMQTYWLGLNDKSETASNKSSGSSVAFFRAHLQCDEERPKGAGKKAKKTYMGAKVTRLIEWNGEVLLRLLSHIVAKRNSHGHGRNSQGKRHRGAGTNELLLKTAPGHTVMDEVKEIITLPQVDAKTANAPHDDGSVEIDPQVAAQLSDYVTVIASMYNDNPCKFPFKKNRLCKTETHH